MKILGTIQATILGSSLVLGGDAAFGASSGAGGAHVPAGETLRTKISLPQAALCDDGVRLEKGSYDASIKSMGDGSVRVTISGNGKTGHVTGKVQGHEVVVEGGLQPGAAQSVQKVQPGAANSVVVEGGRQPSAANSVIIQGGKQPSFASFGFTPQSQVSPQISGNRLNLVIKGQGSNAILIGLLLPAVQKGGIISPTDLGAQKVQPVGK